jgi:hypothetical protein
MLTQFAASEDSKEINGTVHKHGRIIDYEVPLGVRGRVGVLSGCPFASALSSLQPQAGAFDSKLGGCLSEIWMMHVEC